MSELKFGGVTVCVWPGVDVREIAEVGTSDVEVGYFVAVGSEAFVEVNDGTMVFTTVGSSVTGAQPVNKIISAMMIEIFFHSALPVLWLLD